MSEFVQLDNQKKPFELLISEINDQFNWEKVHKAMMAVGWNWVLGTDQLGQTNRGIPSLETIQNHAYALLKQIYEAGSGTISTGGFYAGWDGGELFLVFTLEETSTEGFF